MAFGYWTDDLSVGDARIDAQHRSIFDRARDLERDVRVGQEDPKPTLAFLRRYALQHFAAEEALLERSGFPDLLPHMHSHRELATQVIEAEARLKEAAPRAGEVVLEVIGRILDHIRCEDAVFGAFMRNNSAGKASANHALVRSLMAVEEDHHQLFRLLGELRDAVRRGQGMASLDGLFPALEAFCRDHFRREELLMELTAYPGMPAHKVSHQELREGLSQQLERHRQGLDSAVGVLELLDRWTLQHLTCEDFELASYLWIQE